MSTYGPEDRALFEDVASKLYDEVASAAGLAASDYRIAEDGELRAAFELLVDMGLLVYESETDLWIPEDPGTVQARIVSPLSQQAAKLLAESSEWASAFSGLQPAWRRSPSASTRGPFTYLQFDAIEPFLVELVAGAEEEVLTAQPQTGRNGRALAQATLRDMSLLERGCSLRTLYQHSARRSAVTRKYVSAVSARGAEVRTLDEFFNRMIIVDRQVALIPYQGNTRVAVAVREPAVVAYLVDVFERSFERARPFSNRENSVMQSIAAEQRAMTLRMLIEGHSDQNSAKRLGVSPRTYAGYVADLKDEFEANTRFQLGYIAGERGLSGEETDSA